MKNNWQTKTLGEVCEIVNGGTPKTNVSAYWDGDIQWITPKDMGKMRSPFIAVTERQITEAGLKNSSAKVLPPNSIILSSRAPIGHLAINGAPMTTNQGCKGLIPNKSLDVNFLYNFLWVSKNLLNDLGSGTTFKELSGTKLKEIQIPLPPLPEQRRIVAILDDVFERVAKAKANAEKNLANAKELYLSYLNGIFSNPLKEWIEKPLEAFCKFENGDRGTNYPNKSMRSATGVPFINAGHLTDNGINMESMDYIPMERFHLLSNGKIRKGDILFCLRGSLGKFASVGELKEGAIASSLVIVRPQQEVVNGFVLAYFQSSLCADLINHFKNGAAQPNLSANSLRKFIAPLPPLAEQRTIVANLDALSTETKQLEAIYRQKLSSLEELEKSVLRSAFRGEL